MRTWTQDNVGPHQGDDAEAGANIGMDAEAVDAEEALRVVVNDEDRMMDDPNEEKVADLFGDFEMDEPTEEAMVDVLKMAGVTQKLAQDKAKHV